MANDPFSPIPEGPSAKCRLWAACRRSRGLGGRLADVQLVRPFPASSLTVCAGGSCDERTGGSVGIVGSHNPEFRAGLRWNAPRARAALWQRCGRMPGTAVSRWARLSRGPRRDFFGIPAVVAERGAEPADDLADDLLSAFIACLIDWAWSSSSRPWRYWFRISPARLAN